MKNAVIDSIVRRFASNRIVWGVVFVGIALGVMNLAFSFYASMYRFERVEDIPKNRVGLVLGTSKLTSDGLPNLFYSQRIEAAKRLYDAKKIDCILLSGDNTSMNYNEPVDMQKSLLGMWIPAERMYLDYAGVRTLDSIIRAKNIFGLNEFTVISQPFHIDRALIIAKSQGLSVVGYEAWRVRFLTAPLTYVREFFSRILVVYDVFTGTAPKFGGEKIEIVSDPNIRPVPNKICSPRE